MKTLTVVGKIGKIYFAECPKCKKYVVTVTLGKTECEACNTKYLIEMSGEMTTSIQEWSRAISF